MTTSTLILIIVALVFSPAWVPMLFLLVAGLSFGVGLIIMFIFLIIIGIPLTIIEAFRNGS